jgi:DNA-binding FadR family transcriptional regulator
MAGETSGNALHVERAACYEYVVNAPPKLAPIRRAHAADEIFDQLAAAILRGELALGAALEPERVLAERFEVSRIVVRQAVHRLAEMRLVRVRQGGASIVLNPDDASDLRVLALFYRFAPLRGRRDAVDMIEKQYLQGLSIVEVAARRASERDLRGVLDLVDETAGDPMKLARFAEFEERFWRALAAAGKNRVFKMEVGWWYEALADRPLPRAVATATPKARIAFYRELARRLVEETGATEFYLGAMRPILDRAVGCAARKAKKR